MKKKFLSILLALAMLLTLLPTTALAEGGDPHTHDDDDLSFNMAWTDGDEAPTSAGVYYLNDDVKLTETWTVPAGTTNLCLNGKVLDLNSYHIEVDTGATLNLYDCAPNAKHDDTSLPDGGCITGGKGAPGTGGTFGGGVSVAGTFNMYGGNIVDNKATENGGGVYVSGTFNMYNGSITGNTAASGGGVYAASGSTFVMTGGEITRNTATTNGGGVYVETVPACLAAGTMITMADGSQKPVEALQEGDEIRTFDHDTGLASQANICFFWHYDQPRTGAFTLHFSNDIDVTVVGGHSFYEREENKYITVYADDAEAYIGHSFYNLEAKRWETLESVTFVNEPVETYIVATEKHLNCVAEGMLTCEDDVYTAFMNVFEFDENMKVNAEQKAKDIAKWGTWAWDEALGCPQNVFDAHNLQYAPIAIGKGLVTLAYIKEVIAACAPLYEQAAEAEESPMLLGAVRQCVDEVGETYFEASATSVQNDENSTVTLGGTAQITGNTVNSTDNNLYLGSGKTVTLGTGVDVPQTGENGMSIGVTTGAELSAGSSVAITTNGTAQQTDYFHADDPTNYYVNCKPQVGDVPGHLELVRMPDGTVYQVTIQRSANGAVYADKLYAVQDDTVTLTVTPDEGYQLKEGTLKANGGDVAITGNTFKMPEGAVTVTAEFEKIPAPSSGGGDYTPTVTVPVTGESSKVNVQASVSGSTATVKEIKTEDLAKVTGGESVEIDLTGLKKNIDTAKIPTTTVEKIAEQSGMSVKLSTATVTFDTAATQEIAAQADGKTIELVVDDIKNVSLNAVQKEAVGKLDTALIIDAYLVSGGERLCSESKGGFGGGKATVALPFEIKNNRTAANYSVFYVDDAGNLERLAAKYDAKLGAFVFDIEHFSNYVVAYDENGGYANCPKDATCVYAKFTDANTKAWYHDGVHYCVENGMMNGVTETEFAPKATLTRGMVVAVLAHLNGVETIKGNSWYVPGMEWAMANGISDGTNMTDNVTREQLAAILYRYAVLKGVDTNKFTENTNTLSHNDVFTISDWAASGMHFCIAAGVVNGDNYGNLNPRSTATRAEAAAMFQRFSERVVK